MEDAGAHPVAVHVRLTRNEADADLLGAHFEAEDGDSGQLFRRVTSDVEGERALAETGPGGDDSEVGALESASEQLVQVGESRGDGRKVDVVAGLQGCRLLHVLVEDLANVHEVARASRRADAIEHVFGLGEGGVRVRVPLVADRCYLVGGPDETPHDRGALDDAGIVLDVDGGGHGADEMGEVGRAADLFESLAENELLGDRHLVDGLAAVEQGKASLEAPAVLGYVEVLGGDDSRYLGKGLVVDQKRADDRFFGLDAVGEQSVGVDHGVLKLSGTSNRCHRWSITKPLPVFWSIRRTIHRHVHSPALTLPHSEAFA